MLHSKISYEIQKKTFLRVELVVLRKFSAKTRKTVYDAVSGNMVEAVYWQTGDIVRNNCRVILRNDK